MEIFWNVLIFSWSPILHTSFRRFVDGQFRAQVCHFVLSYARKSVMIRYWMILKATDMLVSVLLRSPIVLLKQAIVSKVTDPR